MTEQNSALYIKSSKTLLSNILKTTKKKREFGSGGNPCYETTEFTNTYMTPTELILHYLILPAERK